MKAYVTYFILFFVLNFAALGFGVYLMDGGPLSDWYIQLNKAPWTPPNPAFGICWSVIMVCFTCYMTSLVKHHISAYLVWIIYSFQWVLNSGWNYTFFNQHYPFLSLIILLLLCSIIAYLLFNFMNLLKWNTLWIIPYFIWLIVAISLNAYIVVYNL